MFKTLYLHQNFTNCVPCLVILLYNIYEFEDFFPFHDYVSLRVAEH